MHPMHRNDVTKFEQNSREESIALSRQINEIHESFSHLLDSPVLESESEE